MNASRLILGGGWSKVLGHARGLIAQEFGVLAGDLQRGLSDAQGLPEGFYDYPFFYDEEGRIIWDVGDDCNVGLGWRSRVGSRSYEAG